jgi:hypothetical protein
LAPCGSQSSAFSSEYEALVEKVEEFTRKRAPNALTGILIKGKTNKLYYR